MVTKEVSRRTGLSHRRADRILVQALTTILSSLSRHETVKLEDFGKFEIKLRRGWKGRHPQSGGRVLIQDRFSLSFRPGKKLKERVAERKRDKLS